MREYMWNTTTVKQATVNNREISFPHGHVVGGSGAVNGMVWTRGAASDFNAWRDLGNPGWGWNDMLPYFRKVSRLDVYEARGLDHRC